MGMLSQPRRSWEAGTEKAFTGQPSREENKKNAAGVRTSAPELSWISDAVPSRLGARKHRPVSPPSPSGKQKPAEAHWTASFGTATDWVVPGGLDSPGKADAGKSSAAPPGNRCDGCQASRAASLVRAGFDFVLSSHCSLI